MSLCRYFVSKGFLFTFKWEKNGTMSLPVWKEKINSICMPARFVYSWKLHKTPGLETKYIHEKENFWRFGIWYTTVRKEEGFQSYLCWQLKDYWECVRVDLRRWCWGLREGWWQEGWGGERWRDPEDESFLAEPRRSWNTVVTGVSKCQPLVTLHLHSNEENMTSSW